MTHTVEQRDDRGPLAYRRRERLDRIVEVVGLATQQHDVKLVLDGVGLDDRRILQRYVAVRAFDHEACGGKLRGTARPHQKGDVAAGLQHPAAEVSANGPRANDENAHLSIPLVVGYRIVQNVAHPRLPCSWTSTYQKGHSVRSPESDSVAGYPRGTQCSISKNANGHALGGIVASTAYSFLAFARHVSTAALSVRCALPRRPT